MTEQWYAYNLENLEEMNKLLDTYNMPELEKKKRQQNRSVENNEIEALIRSIQLFNQEKFQDLLSVLLNCIKHTQRK